MTERRYCTKENPMPLELGDRAKEMGVIWDHDQIEDLDPENLCERWVPFKCHSCGYQWMADLGD